MRRDAWTVRRGARPRGEPRIASHALRLLAAILVCVASSGRAATYALVIGIDRYEHIAPLQGAVNDAVDIASAVSELDPEELVLLIDGRATRDAILSTWQRFLDIAAPGDSLIVTFAGHGASEPAHHPETETDGRDETLLLAGFSPHGPAAAARIRDDEIAALIAQRPDVQHIVVADSCHSGTAIRSTQFDLSYRFFTHDGIVADPLPPPPPPPPVPTARETGMPSANSVFFAAVGDAELAPEIDIDGVVRGGLSYSFARGLRGEADRDHDGIITKGELETHVRRNVKALLDGRQKPRVSPAGDIGKPLFRVETGFSPDGGAFAREFGALPEVPLTVVGRNPAFGADAISGALAAPTPTQGGVVVDFDRRELRSGMGERLRRLTVEVGHDWRRQTQAVVDKIRMVNALEAHGVSSRIDVTFPYGDVLYFEDDPLRILVTGRSTSHVTVLNFSAEGRLNWLYPRYPPIDTESGFDDPPELDAQTAIDFDAFVVPPFGKDHIVVVETAGPQEAVRRAARRFDGTDALPRFWQELHRALGAVPHAVGVHSYVTRER